MHRTKLAILASTALCLGFEFAAAADLPVKARPMPYVADPWVGFYAGGNIGYSWGRTDAETTVGSFVQPDPFIFTFPGGSTSTDLKPNGIVGGLQAGYILRIAAQWLAGVEADFQWTGQKGSGLGHFSAFTSDCTSSDCAYRNTTDVTAKLSWFGTVRGTVGYEVYGLWFYGTFGVAYGKVSVSGANSLVLIDNVTASVVGNYTTLVSFSKTKVGLAGGAGIAGLIGTTGMTWKLEYLHIDLGSIGSASFNGVPAVAVNIGNFTDDIVRIGVNIPLSPRPYTMRP
jgi:outer membrane immunogenic protein